MSEQLSEKGKDLVKYMPQAVNALADRLMEKLEERLLYGEKPQTNADRIRGMTDEELAELFKNLCCPYSLGGKVDCNIENRGCGNCWLSWLKAPVEVQDDEQ